MLYQIKTVYREGKQQEFGWLPAEYYAEIMPMAIGQKFRYSAFNGKDATKSGAIADLLYKIHLQTGDKISLKDCKID